MKPDAVVRSTGDHTDASVGCHRAKTAAQTTSGAASLSSHGVKRLHHYSYWATPTPDERGTAINGNATVAVAAGKSDRCRP